MRDLWLNIDEGQVAWERPPGIVFALSAGLIAVLLGRAIAVMTGADLPYLFVVSAVALSATRSGFRAGLCALVLAVSGTILVNTGNPAVQQADTIAVICLCLAISGAGEAFRRVRSREKSLIQQCSHREALLQKMFDTSQAVILIADKDDRIVAVNSAGCRLFELARDEIIGTRMPDRLDGMDPTEAGRHVIKTSDGSVRLVRLSATDLLVRGNRFRTVYIRDETATVSAAEALATTQRKLSQVASAAALGLLGSSIAHELNQPLAAATIYIGAASSILTNLDPVPETAVTALVDAGGQVLRAADILKQLRTFIGHRPTDARWTDVGQIISDAAKLGSLVLKLANATLEVSIDPAAGEMLVDPIQIQQVLVNLLVNAADAVRGCARRTVRLGAHVVRDGDIAVSVEDSGAGIPDDMHDHIFQAFHSTKRDGLGVGLAISTRIVEALGGKLTCSNGGDHGGAVFRFTLQGRHHKGVTM